MIKKLNLYSPKTSRMRGDLIEAFKIVKGIGDLPLDYVVQVRCNERGRLHHHHMIAIPKARLTFRHNNFQPGEHRLETVGQNPQLEPIV